MDTTRIVYDDRIARWFGWASIIWGLVGMLLGVVIALQLAWWPANVTEYFSFGRLRPLHTNAVIFAFVGNMMFAGIYYSTQRLLKQRLASDRLSWIHFWGWQAIIVSAAVSFPLGITQGKEYAELEWPIDIAIALVWVVFAVNFFWTLARRNEKQLYVAIWFYIATIVTIAVLHIVNALVIPVSLTRGYSIFGGVQDALVQWWYAHNAVAFFLTTPILGIMYYFVPKAADRPVFSYRLSVVHFWSLVFLYIWAGPHHLLNTVLPDWAQTLGMIFSVMLWAPSWGGMINGLMTLRGAWDKLRRDPVLKFFAAGVTFYGMSTFEGPLLSIKAINGLAHYTDWIIGHVHSGALGWNGFMAAGMLYWMLPRLFGTKLYSEKAANWHFWLGTVGILLYVVSMWVAGITQGLMWRELTEDGGLMYPSFVETVIAINPMYWTRMVGGLMFLVGFIMMAWNLYKTCKAGKAVDGETELTVVSATDAEVPWAKVLFGMPVIISTVVIALVCSVAFMQELAGAVVIFLAFWVGLFGIIGIQLGRTTGKPPWHAVLEGRALIFTVLTVLSVLVGGAAEIVPLVITSHQDLQTIATRPYTPLELEGRDVYIREGCYTCHSQMIRPFTWETARYGAASEMEDSLLDHPFQWGSKRNGPDLAREGGVRSNNWHYQHMMDPRQITPGSIMPAYPHLVDNRVDFAETASKVRAMRTVGVPYTAEQTASAEQDAQAAGEVIASELHSEAGIELEPNSHMVALIAYLQRLGKPEGATSAAAATEQPTSVAMAAPGED